MDEDIQKLVHRNDFGIGVGTVAEHGEKRIKRFQCKAK